MLNILSLMIGLAGIACALFLPLSRDLHWVIIPLALVGTIIGMAARRKTGRDLNLAVVVLGGVLLATGGKIL